MNAVGVKEKLVERIGVRLAAEKSIKRLIAQRFGEED
jgi:hypothetical protein